MKSIRRKTIKNRTKKRKRSGGGSRISAPKKESPIIEEVIPIKQKRVAFKDTPEKYSPRYYSPDENEKKEVKTKKKTLAEALREEAIDKGKTGKKVDAYVKRHQEQRCSDLTKSKKIRKQLVRAHNPFYMRKHEEYLKIEGFNEMVEQCKRDKQKNKESV